MADSVVELNRVSKTYRLGLFHRKRVKALTDFSLTIGRGEVFGIIGPNGAGKSTAIKILLNLVFPTEGTATLFGRPVSDAKARERVGYVPENPVPYEHLSGREYLEFQGGLLGLHGAPLTAQIDRVLERVELGKHANMPIRRYSKGMTQRAMLAGALLGEPELVVLDEPTSGLDPLGRRLVRDVILELKAKGATLLFCTHIISDVETLCDRVALLAAGKVHRQGTVAELMRPRRVHEVTLENVSLEAVRTVTGEATEVVPVGSNLMLKVPDERLQETLALAVQHKWFVARVAPSTYSLEDAFLETVQNAAVPVGAEVQ